MSDEALWLLVDLIRAQDALITQLACMVDASEDAYVLSLTFKANALFAAIDGVH